MKRTYSKKLVAAALAAIAALLVAAFAVACNDKPTETQHTPVKLILDYDDVKTDYLFDEPFTYAGLKVSVEMSDGSKQDVTSGYKVTPPEMLPGQHMVTVTYGSLTAKYPIYVEDVIKSYDDTETFRVEGDGVYTIEAENIDLDKCIAEPLDDTVGFIGNTKSLFISEKKYLQNIGTKGNCIGASFYSVDEHDGVMLAVNVGNMTQEDIALSDAVAMYFGFSGGADMGELDLTGMTLKANSWQTLVFDDLSLETYGNVIVEFIDDADIVWDSARIIVGSNGINVNSAVELSVASEPVKLEVENMNTEKLVTTDSVVAENGLKFGQPNLKDGVTGTSGKYVSDLKTGAAVSSWIYADDDMKVNFKLNANVPAGYDLSANWKFTLDGYIFDGASASSDGWTEVDLGTVGLKAGRHLFAAELIGQACEVDNVVFAASELASGDNVILVEDMPADKDAVIYNYGQSYRTEAEDLFDKSGWVNRNNTADQTYPIEYTPGGKSMINPWWHKKDDTRGMGVTNIADGSVFKINFTLKTRAQIVFKIRVRKWKCGDIFPDKDVVVKTGNNNLYWRSNDNFKHSSDNEEDMPWGILRCDPITLDAGDHVIELTSKGVCYDWFEIETYDPSYGVADIHVTDNGSYKVEAEALVDRKGWTVTAGQETNDLYISVMFDNWSRGDASGICVARMQAGSKFVLSFTLTERSVVKISAAISKWGYSNTSYDQSWMENTKIGDSVLNFAGKAGTSFKDEAGGSRAYFGIAESNSVTLEAGRYEFTWSSATVNYDYFILDVSAPAA